MVLFNEAEYTLEGHIDLGGISLEFLHLTSSSLVEGFPTCAIPHGGFLLGGRALHARPSFITVPEPTQTVKMVCHPFLPRLRIWRTVRKAALQRQSPSYR